MRVFWKLMNLRDCVWEIQYQIIMKTILQEKVKIHYSTTIQVIKKRIMVNLGLLKSGKVELRSTIDQGNLSKLLGIYCKKLPLIVKNLFSTEMRIP